MAEKKLCCPNCGEVSRQTQEAPRLWRAECKNIGCQVVLVGYGKTESSAHDALVAECELWGHTAHLENTLSLLARGVPNG